MPVRRQNPIRAQALNLFPYPDYEAGTLILR